MKKNKRGRKAKPEPKPKLKVNIKFADKSMGVLKKAKLAQALREEASKELHAAKMRVPIRTNVHRRGWSAGRLSGLRSDFMIVDEPKNDQPVGGFDFGQDDSYTYVTHEQAEAYAGEALASMAGKPSRVRRDAFTEPEGRKTATVREVDVVASAGRYVEVPED